MIGALLEPRAARKSGSYSPGDPALASLFGSGPTRAGPSVSEEESLSLPAVFRGVDNLCSHLAMLPLPAYRRTGPDAKDRASTHQVHKLLNRRANSEMTSFNFRRSLKLHTVLWGNGLAEIERDRAGKAQWVWPLLPGQASLRRIDGELTYEVRREDGSADLLAPKDMIHISHLGPDGLTGYGLIADLARENVGQQLALAQYVQSFYGNNMALGVIVTTDEIVDADGRQKIINDLEEAHKGANKAFRGVFIDGGAKVNRMGMDHEAAQLVESWTMSIDDVARLLNVPPPMLFELSRATFSNITELGSWYERFSLGPWFKCDEQEYSVKLFTEEEQDEYFVEYVAEGLLRASIDKRMAAHQIALQNGIRNVDEVRGLENMNPLPDGKGQEFRVPLNTAPIGQENQDDDDDKTGGLFGGGSDSGDTLRTQIADAHTIAFDEALRRMDAIEERARARAETTGRGLDEWAGKFRDGHRVRMRTALIPCVEALAGSLRPCMAGTIPGDDWEEFVGEFTARLVESELHGGEPDPVDCKGNGLPTPTIPERFVAAAMERFS